MPVPAARHVASSLRQFARGMGHALRPVWRRPAFAVTAIVSLAVGIGAVTTVLSVVNALLIQPLPYTDPARLVAIWPAQTFAGREIAAIRARSKVYDQVVGLSSGWLMTLTDVNSPRQFSATRVSGNFFQTLGVSPFAGRTFGTEAEVLGNDKVAVLSYEFWQSAFDGDRSVVGRSISLSGTSYLVAGIMPKGFSFRPGTDMWTPLTMDPSEMIWTGATAMLYGRLTRGATAESAAAEMRVLADQMRAEFDHPPSWSGRVQVVGLQENMVGGVRTVLLVLLAAVAFLLLIAVANVSNLFLVRTAERRQEMAVRTSLGAQPLQIVKLLLGESVALGMVGGVFGIGLAYLGVGLLRRILPSGMPRLAEIAVDTRVLAAAVLITGLSAVIAGVASALQGLGTRLATRIRSGRTIAGSGNGTRGVLVAVEVALALVLTIGAAVMGRTLISLNEVDRGLRTDHLLTMRLQPTAASTDGYRNYWRAVLGQLQGLPGVVSAATILHLPTSGRNWQADIEVDGRPLATGETLPRAGWQSVSDGYFSTAGMRVLKGRPFDATDGANAPRVVALNSVLADALFPNEDPVGKRIRAGNATAKDWATVVAVVSSVRHDSLSAPPAPELYLPFDQLVVVANSLVIRTTGDPMVLAPVVRDRIHGIDRSVPISEMRTMDDLYSRSLQRQRMILVLFGLFAGAGLLLSAVGIYGVVAYGVRQRMSEIGIRVALGADAMSIKRLIVSQGLRYAFAGIVVGVPVAIGLSRFMRGFVFGVPATDPLSFAMVPAFLLLIAMAASWIPARRAARADPCEVLRQ